MKINIHTPSGLIPISPEVTKQTIIEALGYTPADQAAYDSIDATDDTTFYIIDSQQHILAKVDADGLHAAIMTVNGKDVESGLIYDIKELDDSAFYIVDKDQNVICRIDENGLTTTNISAIDAVLSGYSVVEHIEDEVIHVTAEDRERWDNKSDFESITEDDNRALSIVDKDSNIIARFDGDGLHTTGIEANNADLIGDLTASDAVLSGESVVEHMNDYDKHLGDEITVSDPSALTIVDKNNKSIAIFDADGFTTTYVESYDVKVDGTSVLGHIEDNTRHITSSERSTWNTVTSKATKTELNTHIADTKKHFGDELRLDDNTTLYINDKNDNTIVKVSAEGLTAGEVILQSGKDQYSLLDHVTDQNIHLQEGERAAWNAKADKTALDTHIANKEVHLGDEIKIDDDTAFYINDASNSTIVKVDSEGLNASGLFLQGKQVATEEYVNDKVTGLFEFKGSISSNEEVPAVHEVGDTYRIKVAGTYAGNVCEMGDMLVCIANGTTANNADWTVMQQNWSAVDGKSDLAWNTSVTLATIGGIDINAKLPANPNKNTTYTFTGGTNKITVDPSDADAYDVSITPSISLSNGTKGSTTTAGTFLTGVSGSGTTSHKVTATAYTGTLGSTTKGIYFDAGVPKEMAYSVNIDVPANAKFTDTNTKVTSAANHYTPTEVTTAKLSADASSTTAASWGTTSLVTGVDIKRDDKGHVVGIAVDSIKMPSNPDTKYSAGTGLSLSGTTFNHSNSVTAGTASGSTGTLSHGSTLTIPSITYDAQGHITGTSTTTCTLPGDNNTTYEFEGGINQFYVTSSNGTKTPVEVLSNITTEDVTTVETNADITGQWVIYITDLSDSSETSFEIKPNRKYIFGTKQTLTITFAAPTDTTIVNNYFFEFTSGSTATTLSLPNTVRWKSDLQILPNKTYQINIENNLGVIGEWSNG